MRQMDIWSVIDAPQVDALILDAEYNGRGTLTAAQRAKAETRARETQAALRMLEDAGRADVVEVLREAIRTQVRSYGPCNRSYFHRQMYGPILQLRPWRGGSWREIYAIRIDRGVLSYRYTDDSGYGLLRLADGAELLRAL